MKTIKVFLAGNTLFFVSLGDLETSNKKAEITLYKAVWPCFALKNTMAKAIKITI